MRKAKILWFTGLSGSGKSTIANILKKKLTEKGKSYKVFDGDNVRKEMHKHLGFSREDIIENNRLIAGLCKKHSEEFDFIIVPIISPFRDSRENARKMLGDNFIEIFVDCPYEVCRKRDVKGLYKKAHSGEIENFIGLHQEYEKPLKPEILLKSNENTADECANQIINYIGLN